MDSLGEALAKGTGFSYRLGMRVLLLSGITLLAFGLESRIVLRGYLGRSLAKFGSVLLVCTSSKSLRRGGHLVAEVS